MTLHLTAMLLGALTPLAPALAAADTLGTAPTPPSPATAAPTPGSVLPVLPEGPLELHGTWDGQPFWARVLPADGKFGQSRVLQLSWQPPTPEQLGGTHLVDCPFILLDEHARVVAWNGRDSLSQVAPGTADGYVVTRELVKGEGVDAQAVGQKRVLHCPRGWDLHLAPLLLALCWRGGAAASNATEVPCIDLFGPRDAESMRVSVSGVQAVIAGTALRISADPAGHLRTLTDATTGAVRLSVEGP